MLGYTREIVLRADFAAQTDLALKSEELSRRTAALVTVKEDLRLVAEQRNQDKSKFLSDAAHDLRNIMHGLSLNLEVADISAERSDFDKAINM
jgi:signal transduction histidine kinase